MPACYPQYGICKNESSKKHIDIALKYPNPSNTSALYSTALEIYSKLGFNNTAKVLYDTVIEKGNIYGKKYARWIYCTISLISLIRLLKMNESRKCQHAILLTLYCSLYKVKRILCLP